MASFELARKGIYHEPSLMRTILLTVFQSFIARSFLWTDAFQEIIKSPDTRVVLLVPDFKVDFYREQFPNPNLIIEGLSPRDIGRTFSTWLQRFAELLLPTYYRRCRIALLRRQGRYGAWLRGVFISYVIALLPGTRSLYRFFNLLLSDVSLFDPYLEKYHPNLVFSPDIYHHTDAHLLAAARRRGIPIAGMVRSWDCPTNKNLLRVVPDEILVNNNIMKEELIRLHSVPPENIHAMGFPQFDEYFRLAPTPRNAFFHSLGIDISKRLIVLAPGGPKIVNADWQYVDILLRAMDDGKLPPDIQILVRNHPQDPADFSHFSGDSRLIVERPGTVLRGYSSAEIGRKDIQHVFDTMTHCEMLISVNTSLGLEAVLRDKPHIMLGFDGHEQRHPLESVARYHREDNMNRFIMTGAVSIAQTADDLIRRVNEYLAHPGKDSVGRERARQEIIEFLDAHSGRRVGSAIVELLWEKKTSTSGGIHPESREN